MGIRTVVLVPRRLDHGRRDELWAWVRNWLTEHHPDYPICEGASPDGPFNRGAAINDAARKAGDWDVAIVSDADNIADPQTLERAVERAYLNGGCVFPFETYVYLDEFSSDRLMNENNWFVAPLPPRWAITREHRSGIQCLSRTAYEQVGGFIELAGWGYEDCVTAWMLNIFTNGIEHLGGGAYHLWHPRLGDPETSSESVANRKVLADVMALSAVPDQLREYLRSGGHPIP